MDAEIHSSATLDEFLKRDDTTEEIEAFSSDLDLIKITLPAPYPREFYRIKIGLSE